MLLFYLAFFALAAKFLIPSVLSAETFTVSFRQMKLELLEDDVRPEALIIQVVWPTNKTVRSSNIVLFSHGNYCNLTGNDRLTGISQSH